MLRILVDVDDTMAEFTQPWLDLIADIVGKRYIRANLCCLE